MPSTCLGWLEYKQQHRDSVVLIDAGGGGNHWFLVPLVGQIKATFTFRFF